MLMYFKIYFIIHSTYLRYLSENKIEALPDKIFKGLKNLKALWVQLITYKKKIYNIWGDGMNMIQAFKIWHFSPKI